MSVTVTAKGNRTVYQVINAKGAQVAEFATMGEAQELDEILKKIGGDLSLGDVRALKGAAAMNKAQGRPPLDLSAMRKVVGKRSPEDLATRGTKAMRTAQGRPAEELTAKK